MNCLARHEYLLPMPSISWISSYVWEIHIHYHEHQVPEDEVR